MTLPKLSDYTSGRLSPKELLAGQRVTQEVAKWETQGWAVLPAPPSANAYWRSITIKGVPRVLVSREGRAYRKLVAARVIATPITAPIGIEVRWFRRHRRGDLDNRLKVVIDALRGIAYQDDKQIVELHAYRVDGGDDTVTVSWWAT